VSARAWNDPSPDLRGVSCRLIAVRNWRSCPPRRTPSPSDPRLRVLSPRGSHSRLVEQRHAQSTRDRAKANDGCRSDFLAAPGRPPPSLHVATSGIETVAGMLPSSKLSLATETSWKNDVGGWESRSEWHRCVAFGKLADLASTLSKRAHVAVEGELPSHEQQREVAVGPHRDSIPQQSGKSASTPCSSSTAVSSANRMTTTTRTSSAECQLLT